MADNSKNMQLTVRNSAYRKAFGRLDESLEKYEPDDTEKTELLGRRIFGHLWGDSNQTIPAL